MRTSLVVLAAGIGSRYGGGIKQLEGVGPSGELIIDYTIHDALEAGFDKVVFIIRKDLDKDFREIIGDRIAAVTEVAYAYQELTMLPEGFSLPEGRTKPWGTTHAVLCAKDAIREPFVIINADDYYGKDGLAMLRKSLTENEAVNGAGRHHVAMAGFLLGNTLSDNGGVTRGICSVDGEGHLTGIRETKNIIRTPDGAGIMTDDGIVPVDTGELVSMNMWGLHPEILPLFEEEFPRFLSSMKNELKDEYLLPIEIDSLLHAGLVDIEVLKSSEKWIGVTYHEDREMVQEAFAKLVENGVYPSPLM